MFSRDAAHFVLLKKQLICHHRHGHRHQSCSVFRLQCRIPCGGAMDQSPPLLRGDAAASSASAAPERTTSESAAPERTMAWDWRREAMISSRSVPLAPFELFHRDGESPRWTMADHYRSCGQSCVCCRWRVAVRFGEDRFGVCPMCESAAMMFCLHATLESFTKVHYFPLLCFLTRKLRGSGPIICKRVFAFLDRCMLPTLTVTRGISHSMIPPQRRRWLIYSPTDEDIPGQPQAAATMDVIDL